MRTALAIAIAILMTGCPGNQPEDSAQNSPPPKKSAVAPPGTGAAATASTEVQLTEYGMQMPDTLPAGPTRFRIANAGKENHNFVIEGPGVQTKLLSDLPRGDSAEVAVTLQPGTYNVYCPVDGHKGKGMQRTLTVK